MSHPQPFDHSAAIDASVLTDATELPARCSRHGRPATTYRDFHIVSRPPKPPGSRLPWSGIVSIIANLLWFWMHVATTPVRGWPLCDWCHRRRRRNRILTRVMFWGGLATAVGALVGGIGVRVFTGQPASRFMAVLMLTGLALVLLAAIPLTRGRLDKIARAQTSSDGTWVRVTRPHPEFRTQMRRLFGTAWRDRADDPD